MMGMFLLIAILMVAAALSFVAVPLLRHRRNGRASDTALRRLHALDAALAAGVIETQLKVKGRRNDHAPRIRSW